MQFLLYARREYADHALMPAGIEKNQARRASRGGCGMLRMLDGKRVLQHGLHGSLHIAFDFPTLVIKGIELQGNSGSIGFIISDEALDAKRHVVEAARRVQSRPEDETQFIDRCLAKIP